MKFIEIRMAVMELRKATRPEQRTAYERALHALADLADRALGAIDGEARREMTDRQIQLLRDLREAVPTEGVSKTTAADEKPAETVDHVAPWIRKIEQMHSIMVGDQAKIVEQLRHACAVAFGDLIAHGMPAETSTGKLLHAALRAVGEKP